MLCAELSPPKDAEVLTSSTYECDSSLKEIFADDQLRGHQGG